MENNKQKTVYGYHCEKCNKDYSSYQSYWNHNKNKHKNNEVDCGTKEVVNEVVCGTSSYNCKFCQKIFNDRSNKYKHQKICKLKDTINDKMKLELLKEENKKNELELKKIYAEIKLAKLSGNITNNTTNNNTTNNTHNQTNNGTINNIFYKYNDISYDTLTKQERNEIFNSYNMIEESIKKIHFNPKKPEQNNIYITNLKDPYCNVFTGKQFSALMKHEFLPDLIDVHLFELCMSKDKYKLKDIIANKIDKLEERIGNDDKKYTDENDKIFKNYKEYLTEIVKLLIYNLSDKHKLESLKKINNFVCKELDLEDDLQL